MSKKWPSKDTQIKALILNVLAARHRLGENAWTFEKDLAGALQVLAAEGLVWFKAGIIEGTVLAGFTDTGREQELSATYVPPNQQRDVSQAEYAVSRVAALADAWDARGDAELSLARALPNAAAPNKAEEAAHSFKKHARQLRAVLNQENS